MYLLKALAKQRKAIALQIHSETHRVHIEPGAVQTSVAKEPQDRNEGLCVGKRGGGGGLTSTSYWVK